MSLSLQGIAEQADKMITPDQIALDKALDTLGPDSDPATLLKFQALLAKNSTAVAIFSGTLKERSDTLKGIVQKF